MIYVSIKSSDRWKSMGLAVLSHFVFTQSWAKMNFSKPGTATVHKPIPQKFLRHGRIVFSCGCQEKRVDHVVCQVNDSEHVLMWVGQCRTCVLMCPACVFTLRFSVTFAARVEGAKRKVCGTFLSCAIQVLGPWNFPKKQDTNIHIFFTNYKKVWNFKMLRLLDFAQHFSWQQV